MASGVNARASTVEVTFDGGPDLLERLRKEDVTFTVTVTTERIRTDPATGLSLKVDPTVSAVEAAKPAAKPVAAKK